MYLFMKTMVVNIMEFKHMNIHHFKEYQVSRNCNRVSISRQKTRFNFYFYIFRTRLIRLRDNCVHDVVRDLFSKSS